jgi:hypothetical protein
VAAIGDSPHGATDSRSAPRQPGPQDHDDAEGELGTRIGRLGNVDLVRLNRAMTVFLGLAG